MIRKKSYSRHIHKPCKACNSSVELCNKYATKPVTDYVMRLKLLQGILQGYYMVITGFYRYITGFIYYTDTQKLLFKDRD